MLRVRESNPRRIARCLLGVLFITPGRITSGMLYQCWFEAGYRRVAKRLSCLTDTDGPWCCHTTHYRRDAAVKFGPWRVSWENWAVAQGLLIWRTSQRRSSDHVLPPPPPPHPPNYFRIYKEYIFRFFGLRYCNFTIITPDNSEKIQTQKHVALQLPII
jgi:hypothetical protein